MVGVCVIFVDVYGCMVVGEVGVCENVCFGYDVSWVCVCVVFVGVVLVFFDDCYGYVFVCGLIVSVCVM